MLLQQMRSERFQNLFRPKAYSADTIPAGKQNKLPEFQENFCTIMKFHDVTGKRSELKRWVMDVVPPTRSLHIYINMCVCLWTYVCQQKKKAPSSYTSAAKKNWVDSTRRRCRVADDQWRRKIWWIVDVASPTTSGYIHTYIYRKKTQSKMCNKSAQEM